VSGNIFNSKGAHVANLVGPEIFDLSGKNLYDPRGVNIYRPSGELVGHFSNTGSSQKRLDRLDWRLAWSRTMRFRRISGSRS
jgi:hypothetical protein